MVLGLLYRERHCSLLYRVTLCLYVTLTSHLLLPTLVSPSRVPLTHVVSLDTCCMHLSIWCASRHLDNSPWPVVPRAITLARSFKWAAHAFTTT